MQALLAYLPSSEWDSSSVFPSEGVEFARCLLRQLAAAPAAGKGARVLTSALRASSLSASLLVALGGPRTRAAQRAVDCALVLLADHELNASTFSARVAAGAGADLPRCLLAGHATLSGRRHGGVCDRIQDIIRRFARPEQALAWVRYELAARRALPGFGHPLYPKGDPRATALPELAEAHGARSERAKTAFALLDAMKRGGHPPPTLDAGLVALCACLDGLQQLGANHSVPVAKAKLEEWLNDKAHD
jgi:citrate synthase